MTFSSRPVGGGSTSIHANCHDLDINMTLHAMTTIGETKVRGPPVRVAPRGGDLASAVPGGVVMIWSDMGPFSATREWNSEHLYGYVCSVLCTVTGEIFALLVGRLLRHIPKHRGINTGPLFCLNGSILFSVIVMQYTSKGYRITSAFCFIDVYSNNNSF